MQGHIDIPLNEIGKKQATLVAKRLANEQWDVLISSDLSRARETALEISMAVHLPIVAFDRRLREIDKGALNGTTEEERVQLWGSNWRELDHGDESLESLRKRGVEAVQDIVLTYPGKKIIVVSHGALLRQTLLAILQIEQLEVLENTSVTTIVKQEEDWKLIQYNCTSHLDMKSKV